MATPFWDAAEGSGILFEASNIEGHNLIGPSDRYQNSLRRLYNAAQLHSPCVQLAFALDMAVKAINDTMGPKGLISGLPFFGRLPRFHGQHTFPTPAD